MQPTSAGATTARVRRGRALARGALIAGAVCAVAMLLTGPLYRADWWPLATSMQTLRYATFGALAGLAAALLAFGMLAAVAPRTGICTAAMALGVNLLVVAPPLMMIRMASAVPPIHDISTDTSDPPRFVAILPLRRAAPNGVDYPAQTARLQREAYPDIATLELADPPAQAFDRAARAADAMGWQVVASAPTEGRIEATATTFFFGFKDDVVIRVGPAGAGSRIDVRSTSRVGKSDLGTNARRIRAYLGKLRDG